MHAAVVQNPAVYSYSTELWQIETRCYCFRVHGQRNSDCLQLPESQQAGPGAGLLTGIKSNLRKKILETLSCGGPSCDGFVVVRFRVEEEGGGRLEMEVLVLEPGWCVAVAGCCRRALRWIIAGSGVHRLRLGFGGFGRFFVDNRRGAWEGGERTNDERRCDEGATVAVVGGGGAMEPEERPEGVAKSMKAGAEEDQAVGRSCAQRKTKMWGVYARRGRRSYGIVTHAEEDEATR
jgi:hypothetical protein